MNKFLKFQFFKYHLIFHLKILKYFQFSLQVINLHGIIKILQMHKLIFLHPLYVIFNHFHIVL